MSDALRIDATVRVDATQAIASLSAVATASGKVATTMTATGTAAVAAANDVGQHTAAHRAASSAAEAVAAKLNDATAALREETAANAPAVAAYREYVSAAKAAEEAEKALTAARRAGGSAAGFSRTQSLELAHVTKSLFDEIAAGASPLRALTVEGGRIGEIIAGSGGPLKAFGSLVSLLGGPLVVAGVAAAAVFGGVAFGFSAAQSAAVKLQRELDIAGNQAGLTAADVESMGSRIAAATASGAGAATEAVTKLATSGKFTRDEIEQLGAAAVGLAARTGESADKIVGAFVKAADGPTAYARQFAAAYVGLDAATVAHIARLEDQGQKDAALAVLSKALYDQLGKEAPGKLGFLERAWDAVAGAIGRATKAALDYGKTDTSPSAATNQLANDIQRRIDAIKASSAVQRGYGDVSPTSASDIERGYAPQLSPNQQIAALEQQKAAALGLSAATDAATASQRAADKVQRDGVAAAEDLDKNYGKIGDSARRAADGVAKFRAELKAALAANPTDPKLLDYQRRAPEIEKSIRDTAEPGRAASDKKAATAAAEEAKRHDKLVVDLNQELALIEAKAVAAGEEKTVGAAQLEILRLEDKYHGLITDKIKERVTAAIQEKALTESILKTAVEAVRQLDQLKVPTSVDAIDTQRAAARKKEGTDPNTLGFAVDNIANQLDDAFWAARGKKFGESAGQQFQATASTIGNLIGNLAGAKIGTLVTRALQSAGKSGELGGLDGSLQLFQDSFKAANKATVDKLGDLFTSVFGSSSDGFAKTAGTAFAGAAQGQIAGTVTSALGIKTSGVGSELGGAIGSLIPALGPLGGIIGGAIGGILGGLFGKKATSNSDVLSSGTASGTVSGSNTIQQTAATGLGDQVQNGLAQIAQAFGGTLQDFSPITIGQRNDNYRVDTTGATIGKYNGKDFGTGDAAAAAAVSYAVETALQRGAVGGLSAHVQAVIAQYGDDLNKAITEALKVKNLEDTLADAANPYATAFKDFENQAAQRLQVAKQYGFDVLQVEKVNADARAKLIEDTLSSATQSVKSVIDDLRFGSLATGSVADQRAALQAEEARLTGLVNGGDTSQLSNLSSIVQQLVELDKQAYGSTAAYSTSRDQALSLLDGLVQQTSDKITAAATAAQGPATDATTATTDPSAAALAELNATGDDQVALQQQMAASLAAIESGLGNGGGLASGVLSGIYARPAVS